MARPPRATARLRLPPRSPQLLSPDRIGEEARRAAAQILVEGSSAHTRRSYASALRYWCAWHQARYRQPLKLPVPVAAVVQFLVDHAVRLDGGRLASELPHAIDEALVASGFKGAVGPLKMATIQHRLAVLSKLHQLRRCPNPCADAGVRELLSHARRGAAKRGEVPRQKKAATREPMEAMLATCDDSLVGLRDRAILLLAWSSGGRRRSEVAACSAEHLVRVDSASYLYRMGASKTNANAANPAVLRDKPVAGRAAQAVSAWLEAAGIAEGPVFRRIWRRRVGPALSAEAISDVVKRRARWAGIEGDWAGHSLRSGFITEAARSQIPLGDVMSMSEHRQVQTVLRYYRAGELLRSNAANLLG